MKEIYVKKRLDVSSVLSFFMWLNRWDGNAFLLLLDLAQLFHDYLCRQMPSRKKETTRKNAGEKQTYSLEHLKRAFPAISSHHTFPPLGNIYIHVLHLDVFSWHCQNGNHEKRRRTNVNVWDRVGRVGERVFFGSNQTPPQRREGGGHSRGPLSLSISLSPIRKQRGGGGRGGDTHRLTFALVSPPPWGHFRTTQ